MISSGKLPDKKAKPKVDDGYCDVECPFFRDNKAPGDFIGAKCFRDGKDIMYHDWYIAHCETEE